MKWPSINKRWQLVGKSSSFISSQWYNHETCLTVPHMVPSVFGAKLPTEVNCLSAHTSLASPVSLSCFSRNHIPICVENFTSGLFYFLLVICCFLSLSAFSVSVSRSVMPDSLRPHGLQPTRLLCPWDFPGKDTGVGCHFLLQGIFPTQGSNPGILHCRQIHYWLSY